MADNYLEQKMEDMRSGKLRSSSPTAYPIAPRKGFLQVPFPPRRVLVTGGANGIGLAITRAYINAGCKVAVFDIDKERGQQLAQNEGIRFYHMDLCDAKKVEES
ncbi:MAG: SDR family NAD(P)-dependent oxidoreductase, partial [Muribaculaceae bacterium]|nr:SDR family NAD(P)-dependent oxidoreductase [Muribaculaceae bacterium]